MRTRKSFLMMWYLSKDLDGKAKVIPNERPSSAKALKEKHTCCIGRKLGTQPGIVSKEKSMRV